MQWKAIYINKDYFYIILIIIIIVIQGDEYGIQLYEKSV
jgi:hypothetical protein